MQKQEQIKQAMAVEKQRQEDLLEQKRKTELERIHQEEESMRGQQMAMLIASQAAQA